MSAGHCFELVRGTDKDRFLASLFAPDGKRPHLLALYAYNVELARIRESVSEAALGEVRLQWWLDALDGIYAGQTPAHPVAQELARAVATGDLPKDALRNMALARQFDLYDDPMPALSDLEGYLGETSSALIQMGAMILTRDEAKACAGAAGLAGVAMGITGILRSLPLHRARGQCYVPKDLLGRYGVTPAHVLAVQETQGLSETLAELRAQAAKRLGEARLEVKSIPSAAYPAFLPASLTGLYLKRLEALGPRCLTEIADVPQWRRQWELWRKANARLL